MSKQHLPVGWCLQLGWWWRPGYGKADVAVAELGACPGNQTAWDMVVSSVYSALSVG